MAVLLTPPYLQFFDVNGDVLAGGKVNTYTATGTLSTRKPTFTTEAGDVEHPNPVILDAAGRPATGNGSIWLSGTYDIVVTDANDVEIETTLNVSAFTALPSSSDAYFETFSGTGSQTAFTTSEDLGIDEKAIYVWVNAGLQESVTNGTFATDTDWTKGTGWTIGSGVATASGGISTAIEQTAAITLVEGQAYSVTYTITRSAGTLTASVGGTSGTAQSASGTYTEVIVAGSNQTLAFTGAGFTGTLDDVSITQAVSSGYSIQSPTTYTISGTTLTFATAPAAGTNNIYVSAPSLLVGAASSAAADAAVSAAAALASENLAGAYAGQLTIVSTTSLAIGTGSKVFTVASGLALSAGQFILIASDASPAVNYMWGSIASYSGTTLTVTVAAIGGSGTLADWTMYLTGERGATGATGSVNDISGVSTATPAGDDTFIFTDIDDSNATKKAAINTIKGSIQLLETQTASASATIDFTTGIDSTYKEYIIKMINVVAQTNVTSLYMLVSTDGGSSFLAADYQWQDMSAAAATATGTFSGSASANEIRLVPALFGATASSHNLNGDIKIFNPSDATVYKCINAELSAVDSGSKTRISKVGGHYYGATTAIDAFRLLASSGNITSGTFKLYGVL